MNPVALIFFLLCATALLLVPRKWATAILLLGCTYITLGQGIEIASLHFPIYRMMLLVGFIRVISRGERLLGGMNAIDRMMIAFGGWAIFASIFHNQERYGIIFVCGLVYNLMMIYFLIRIWCADLDEIRGVIAVIAFLLVPIAIEMLMEKATGKNLFSVFGGISQDVMVRQGRLRAQGPFLHAILAGTVGATCIPLFIGLLPILKYRVPAVIGIFAGVVMTFASASSGPVMSLIFGCTAMAMWRFKRHLGKFRVAVFVSYLALIFLMTKPPYYLISRIDISGGSTGWHRSFLIEQTFKHLSEWWLFGTDVTRHWMPMQGIGSDPLHTDITNYYISFGVQAGLPAMLLLIAILITAFSWVGKTMDVWLENHPERSFMAWSYGACLFAHAATSISVSYFDQSMVFFWLPIAVISANYTITRFGLTEASISEFDGPALAASTSELAALQGIEWRRRFRVKVDLEDRHLTK